MSKTIKLENQVYFDLDELRGKDETYSDAVAKAIKATVAVAKIQADLHNPGQVNRQQLDDTATTG